MNKIKLYTILSLTLGVLIFNHFFYNPVSDEGLVLKGLNDLQKHSFETLMKMTNLLISLATALFGFIGYLVLENFKPENKLYLNNKFEVIVVFCLSAISIDFGYIFMEKSVEMLSIGIYEPFGNLIRLPQKLQIASFLLTLIFSGRIMIEIMSKKSKS